MGAELHGNKITFTEDVECREVVEALRDVLRRYAEGEVSIYTPNKEADAGKVRFRFDMKDQFGVDIIVKVEDVLADPKGYVHRMCKQLNGMTTDAQRRRQAETAIQSLGGENDILARAVKDTIYGQAAH